MTTAAQHAVSAGVSLACALAVWPDHARAVPAMREAAVSLERALVAMECGDHGVSPLNGRRLVLMLDGLIGLNVARDLADALYASSSQTP